MLCIYSEESREDVNSSTDHVHENFCSNQKANKTWKGTLMKFSISFISKKMLLKTWGLLETDLLVKIKLLKRQLFRLIPKWATII